MLYITHSGWGILHDSLWTPSSPAGFLMMAAASSNASGGVSQWGDSANNVTPPATSAQMRGQTIASAVTEVHSLKIIFNNAIHIIMQYQNLHFVCQHFIALEFLPYHRKPAYFFYPAWSDTGSFVQWFTWKPIYLSVTGIWVKTCFFLTSHGSSQGSFVPDSTNQFSESKWN